MPFSKLLLLSKKAKGHEGNQEQSESNEQTRKDEVAVCFLPFKFGFDPFLHPLISSVYCMISKG